MRTRSCNHQISRPEYQFQDLVLSSKLAHEGYYVMSFKSHSSKLFKHVKSLIKPASKHYPIFHNSNPLTEPTHKAHLFNCYFNSVLTTSDLVLPPFLNCQLPQSSYIGSLTIDFLMSSKSCVSWTLLKLME